MAPGAAQIICEPWARKQAPASGHEARWSLPIVVAARLIEGSIGHATFAHPPTAAVRDLAARVTWSPLASSQFPQRFEAEVTVMFGDGSCPRHASTPARQHDHVTVDLALSGGEILLAGAAASAADLEVREDKFAAMLAAASRRL